MSETALKFGPEWLRALSHGNNNISPPPSPGPTYKLAEFRYGREEMLALYNKNVKMADHLQEFPWISIDKAQLPLALIPMTEEEQRMWASSVNSDGLQRITGKGGGSSAVPSRGRGGSVDRGRGRGRGNVFQRGLSFEDGENVPGSFSRGRGFERSQSSNERNTRWEERDRRFDRSYQNRVDENGIPKKDPWRGNNDKPREDEGGWRSAGSRGPDKWGRGSWRNHDLSREDSERGSVREGEQGFLRNGPTKSGAAYRKNPSHSWDDDLEGSVDQLPEWSVEAEGDTEQLGTFDASGAFMENKEEQISLSENGGSTKSERTSKTRLKESPPKKKEESSRTKSNENSPPRSCLPENSEVPTSETKVPAAKPSEPKKISPTVGVPVPNTRPPPPQLIRVPAKQLVPTPVVNRVAEKPSEDDNFALLEKAAENMMAQWTEEEEQRVTSHQTSAENVEKMAILPIHHEDAYKWFYRDPQGEIQGPFLSQEMLEWFTAGYFTMGLMVRRGCDERFAQLGELIKSWGHVPFVQGATPPPLRVVSLPTTMPHSVQPQPPNHEQQMRLMILQQQLIQQQLLLRQHMQVQQLLGQLKQQESFSNLTPQQQQEVLLQHLIAQQQMHRAPAGMSEPPNMLDPLAQVQLPLLGLTLPPLLKNEGTPLWGIPTSSGNWPTGMAGKQSSSIWDVDVGSASGLQQQQQKDEVEAQLKAEEEARKLEEEMRRREEEERQRHEEEERRKREEDERRRKEEELEKHRRMEEEKRLEEIRRQQEEIRQKEEEKRQLEEMRRLEQQKREEEQKLKEEEKRRLELELERQQELKRQKEMERQQQELALRRLQEQQKARAQLIPPWSNQIPSPPSVSPSLAEIQKLQEKEKHDQEERQRIQQDYQQEMIALQQAQQQLKNSMTWAHKSSNPSPVKSLLEIQQEEAEQAAKRDKIVHEQQKQQNTTSLRCAGVWNNAASQINWEMSRGFWDDAVTVTANGRQKHAKTNSDTSSAFPSLGNPVQTAAAANSGGNSNKAKNIRAMKEKETVMKLFEAHTRPSTDDFTKWCTESLTNLSSSVDVPTFIAFLKDVESPYEVHDYVRSYLGESKDVKEFAKQFLERRSKHRNQSKAQSPEVNMWEPVPAITPSLGKMFHNDSETGGSKNKKKKKNKMQKMDNSMLGFTVQANPDRINVGEIAHVEGL